MLKKQTVLNFNEALFLVAFAGVGALQKQYAAKHLPLLLLSTEMSLWVREGSIVSFLRDKVMYSCHADSFIPSFHWDLGNKVRLYVVLHGESHVTPVLAGKQSH